MLNNNSFNNKILLNVLFNVLVNSITLPCPLQRDVDLSMNVNKYLLFIK